MVNVSIGLPVFNGGEFLEPTLKSILSQTYDDYELIISDNASTDATQEICESYAGRDKRIKYTRLESNIGAAPNYNRVFDLASGKYFKWAAHDDLLRPEFLETCVRAFESCTDRPVLIYPTSEFIDDRGEYLRSDTDRMHSVSRFASVRAFQILQSMNLIVSIFGLFDRERLATTQLIGSYVGSDYVLMFETSLRGKIVRLDGTPLFQRRIHQGSSRRANVSKEDALRWFDPGATSNLSIRQKLYLEYAKSIFRSGDLSMGSKLVCFVAMVLSVSLRRARVALGRWRRKLFAPKPKKPGG